jgi:nucleoside-diphosphate-sugar epimerase
MKVLIIGSEGFIGSHLVRFYSGRGCKVFGVDVLDHPTHDGYTYAHIQGSLGEDLPFADSVDACINAAGSGNVGLSVAEPLFDFERNCVDTKHVLQRIRQKNPSCRYLHISSAAVYGNPVSLPVKETDQTQPLSPYGYHKLISELLCAEYASVYSLNIAVVRPFSVYGPGLRKQLFWDVFQKIRGMPSELTLWGTGMESRDFVFVSDLVAAIDVVLTNSPMKADVYNVASGMETTIRDAVSIFANAYGCDVELHFNNQNRPGDPLYWQADISKLKQLGFTPSVTLETGIRSLAAWMKLLNVE